MKWLQNFTLLMRSNLRTIQEKIENPERMLHQLLVDMEEELEAVRESVAEAIADEIQIGRRVEEARRESSTWVDRAAQAMRQQEEVAARRALEQKVRADKRVDGLEKEYETQKEQTAKLQRAVAELEDKIRQARQKRTLLLARLTRADAVTRIGRAVDRAAEKSAFAQFGRLEQRVERAEAKVEAWERLEGTGDEESDDVEREFEDRERRERLEREYEELRRRIEEIDRDGEA